LYAELRRQVDLHFTMTGGVPNEAPGMHLKTAEMFGWFAGSYTLLTFWATTWWQASALLHLGEERLQMRADRREQQCPLRLAASILWRQDHEKGQADFRGPNP
jgi:hypothetical protein